jgi:transposase-like protein
MPRSKGFPREIKEHAVREYLEGRATMPTIAAAVGTTAATISRWVKDARVRGVQPSSATGQTAGADIASRVAALAPPPAPARTPSPDVSTGDPRALMAHAAQMIERLVESSERARAQGDPRVEATTISAIVKALTEIRQLQASVDEAGGAGFVFSAEELEHAREAVQRKIDAYGPARCPDCGAELRRMWALEGAAPTRNTEASHDTPPKGNKGAAGA